MPMPEGGRVIAGSAKGVRLEAAGKGTRPLSDRVKQALFASLEAEGALDGPFLDLFAGTGAAGIEALSRGAPSSTFVEDNSRACALVAENLRRASLDGGTVVCQDVARFLRNGANETRYEAVFIDPPYDEPALAAGALASLADGAGWLSPTSTVVVKHFWRDEPPEHTGSLTRTRQKRFGETMLSFYTRVE
jgi:16S rRNA (guanine966-N2)-methyltransferase